MPASPDTPPEVNDRNDRSLPGLVRELVNDAAILVRQEIGLARAEIRDNLKDLATHLGQLAVGGSVAVVGVLVLVAFLVVGLGALLDGAYWLSSLIVAFALLGAGAGLGYLGVRRLAAESLAPATTLETLRDTGEWAGDELRELRATLSGNEAGRDDPGSEQLAARPPIALRREAERVAPAPTPPGRKGSQQPPLSAPFHKRVFFEISDDDVMGQAAKVAFYMFSSLPPALLVIFGLTGIFGGEGIADFISSRIQAALPGSADDPESAAGFINRFVEEVVNESAPGPLSIGLVLGIWASSAVFVALTDALNKAYDTVDHRSWFKRRALAIGVMVAFVILFLGGSVVLVGGPSIAEALQLGGLGNILWTVLQWPLAFLLVVAAFFLVYYVLPDRDQSHCKMALFKASAIAAGLWLVATLGFRLYIGNFGSYTATYGFVGAILVLLLWMYVTSAVILVGGEISSEMEREARA